MLLHYIIVYHSILRYSTVCQYEVSGVSGKAVDIAIIYSCGAIIYSYTYE